MNDNLKNTLESICFEAIYRIMSSDFFKYIDSQYPEHITSSLTHIPGLNAHADWSAIEPPYIINFTELKRPKNDKNSSEVKNVVDIFFTKDGVSDIKFTFDETLDMTKEEFANSIEKLIKEIKAI